MSSGKPRALGPAQKCLFGSQQYLAQGKDVITGERDENRRTRAPIVSIEGSVLQENLSAGSEEELPRREKGNKRVWGAGSQEEGTFIYINSAVISGVLGGLILCFSMQNSYAAVGNPHQPPLENKHPACTSCWPLPTHPASQWGGNKTSEGH